MSLLSLLALSLCALATGMQAMDRSSWGRSPAVAVVTYPYRVCHSLADRVEQSPAVRWWDGIMSKKLMSCAEYAAGAGLAYTFRSRIRNWNFLTKAAAGVVAANVIMPSRIKRFAARIPLVRRAIFYNSANAFDNAVAGLAGMRRTLLEQPVEHELNVRHAGRRLDNEEPAAEPAVNEEPAVEPAVNV